MQASPRLRSIVDQFVITKKASQVFTVSGEEHLDISYDFGKGGLVIGAMIEPLMVLQHELIASAKLRVVSRLISRGYA